MASNPTPAEKVLSIRSRVEACAGDLASIEHARQIGSEYQPLPLVKARLAMRDALAALDALAATLQGWPTHEPTDEQAREE